MSDYIEIEEFESNFAQVPKPALKDKNLSLKSKGLYAYLFSLPKSWKVYKSELITNISDGKDSLNSAFKELEKYGYIVSTAVRDSGKFKGFKLKLLISPLRENRNGENHCGKTVNGKSASINKDNSNSNLINTSLFDNKEVSPSFVERCNKFIDKFNELRDSKFRVTDKVKKALQARLKTYKPDEIITALKNSLLDQYHIDTKFKYITPEFILREDKLERYLNQQNQSNELEAAGEVAERWGAPGL